MLYVYLQIFDVMDEKFLNEELNKAQFSIYIGFLKLNGVPTQQATIFLPKFSIYIGFFILVVMDNIKHEIFPVLDSLCFLLDHNSWNSLTMHRINKLALLLQQKAVVIVDLPSFPMS
jgi:hypothetical protein